MWEENVKEKLSNLIEECKFDNNYAVFDCDNTILINDIQFATIYYILKFKKFFITPDFFSNYLHFLFPKEKEKIDALSNLYLKAYNSEINSSDHINLMVHFKDYLNYFYHNYNHVDISNVFFSSLSETEFENLIN